MNSRAVVLVLATLSVTVLAQQKLPSYIKPCDFTKSDFKQCALEHANEAIPHIVKGDKKLNIPVLDPLRLPLIEIVQNNFKFSLTDVKIMGIKDIKATELSLTPKSFDATFHIENLNIIGQYKIDGRVLVLTLKGEGPANITGVGGDYRVKSTVSSYTKDGHSYLKFNKPEIEFTLKRAHFDLGNIFNGDERLGPEINQILNENWQEVLKDVGAPIKETVGTIVETIVSNILSKVPAQDILNGIE